MIYQLYTSALGNNGAMSVDAVPGVSFLFVLEQPLYQNFKAQINADEAQLQDADGNLMTPEEAKAFVATLP